MTASPAEMNEKVVERYMDQPARMPLGIRKRIEKRWTNRPVQLYALADLDASMRLTQTWVALGPEHLAIAADEGRTIRTFERSQIKEVRKSPGLSGTVVTLLGPPDEPPLAVWRYSHRQRRAMENLLYTIELRIQGQTIENGDPDEVYAGSLAHSIREAQASAAVHRLAVVWRLLGYLRPYRRQVALGMAAASLMTLMTLVPPYLTGRLIDGVIHPYQEGTLAADAASRAAWILIGGIAVTYALRQLFVWLRLRLLAMLGENVARDLRTEIYEHLQKLSLSYFSSKRTGSLITRVSSDTDRLWDFIAFGIVEVSISLLMLAGLGAVLMALDWRLGLVMTAPVPLLIYLIYRYGERMQGLFLRAWRKWSSLTDVLSDTIPGIRVVKAFHQEEAEIGRFGERNVSVTSEFNRIHTVWTSFWPLLMLALRAMVLAVWIFALPRLFAVEGSGLAGLSVGTFISFLLYTSMFVDPIEVLGQTARMMNRATSSAYRIFEVLDTKPEIVDVQDAVRLSPVRGRVTFEDVAFAYDGIRPVLKGISFDVAPGEMVGLVGPSGAGKTTVIHLIVRFYEATGGRIRIDGVDITRLDTGHFRRQVGMVLQDPYLFHGTVLENIRYGMPGAGMGAVVDAAKAANAHDFICKLPYGYDTVIGERGHTLSGGERQRVSIARAVLTDPRILLLDEATSSVDTETERKIQEAMDRLIKGRTVFAIAHRLSTLTRASRLFVIEDGRLTEQGTHAELLAKDGGTYRKLHRMQQEMHETCAV